MDVIGNKADGGIGETATMALNRLIEWPHNPRKTRSKTGQEDMAASLTATGQLMPLIVVAADGDLYHVVDGERRRRGMNAIVDAGVVDADVAMRVLVMDPATPLADLIAIATIANKCREDMNPIEEMEAYTAMSQSGMKAKQIAENFNIGVRQVMQRITLGELIPEARDLVRDGSRQLRWAEAMTLGSHDSQLRIVDEIRTNPQTYIDGRSVRMELTRGNIPLASALFDPQVIGDCIVTDLFTTHGEGTFSDKDRFWVEQNKEIKRIESDLRTTHHDVEVVRGRRFNEAGWMRGGVPAESWAIVIVKDDGSVEVREGMVPPAGYGEDDSVLEDGADAMFAEAQAVFGTSIGDDDDGAVSFNPLDNATRQTEAYVEAQVVAGLRLRAAGDPRIAMAFVIAQTLTRHGKLASSMEMPGFNLEVEKRTSAVFVNLKAKGDAYERVIHDAGLLGIRSPSKAVELLLDLTDEALGTIFSWIVSQSVNPGLTPIAFETIEALGDRPMDGWTIDQNYVDTLNSAQKRALADEVVPIQAQVARNASVQKVTRSILAAVEEKALQEDWEADAPQWLPPQVAKLRDEAAAKADAAASAAQAGVDDARQAA